MLDEKPPERKYSRRKVEILDAALALFATRGLEATGLKEIAAHLNLTHPALYYYFSSKEALVAAAVEKAMLDLVFEVEAATQDLPPHPSTKLFEACRAHVKFELKDNSLAPVVNSLLYGPLRSHAQLPEEDHEAITNLQRLIFHKYRDIIVAGQATGDFVSGPAAPLTFGVMGIVSYTVSWFKPDGPQSADDIARHVATQALRSVSAHIVV